jgi:hypothetical protein
MEWDWGRKANYELWVTKNRKKSIIKYKVMIQHKLWEIICNKNHVYVCRFSHVLINFKLFHEKKCSSYTPSLMGEEMKWKKEKTFIIEISLRWEFINNSLMHVQSTIPFPRVRSFNLCLSVCSGYMRPESEHFLLLLTPH